MQEHPRRWSHRRGAAAEESLPDRISNVALAPASDSTRIEAIRAALRLGATQDRISPPSTDMRREKLDRLSELAAELVRLKVDVIVAVGGYASDPAARMHQAPIPLSFQQ